MSVGDRVVWPQYLLAFVCNLGTLSFGIHVGWLAPIQLLLQSDETPLAPHVPPLTLEEISWVGAIPTISLLVGPFICGYFLEKSGRKFAALLATIPNIISYLCLLFANSLYMLYLGRFLSGFAACMFIITPIYVNESTEDNIRGFLGSLTGIFLNVGVFIGFVLGGYTDYTVLNITGLIFPSIFLLFYPWLPESPQYLVTKQRKEAALTALLKLRGGTREQQEEVIKKMYHLLQRNENKKSSISVIRHRAFVRGVAIIMGLFTVQSLTGAVAIITYNVFILKEAGSTIDSALASIVISVLQITGSIVGSSLIDRLGRRKLLLISCFCVFASLSAFSVYLYIRTQVTIEDELGWLPITALSILILSYASGFGTVAHVLLPELFLPQARPFASGICGTWMSMMIFAVIKFFPLLKEYITLAGTFLIFSFSSGFGFVFIYFIIFETKNKSPIEIFTRLGGKIDDKDLVEVMPIVPEITQIKLISSDLKQ